MKVGFIGLGAMGLPMARNVLAGGYPLVVTFHRNRAPADELAAKGAEIVDTAAEVARAADVVITILPADAELEETVLGPNGLTDGLSEGKALIEMTTCTAGTMLKVAEALEPKGIEILDGPVSGGTTGAEDGKLTIMLGGAQSVLEKYTPLLKTMGTNLVHVGSIGQGKVVKIVNQAMAAIHLLAIGEAFALGIKSGASAETLYEVIKTSSGYSRMMDLRLPGFLLEGSFDPGFKLDLMKKDVVLAVQSAKELDIPLSITSAVADMFENASQAGKGDLDFAAAAQHLASLSGADIAADE